MAWWILQAGLKAARERVNAFFFFPACLPAGFSGGGKPGDTHLLYSTQRSFQTCKIFAWFVGKLNYRVRLCRECGEYLAVQTVCEMMSFPRGW